MTRSRAAESGAEPQDVGNPRTGEPARYAVGVRGVAATQHYLATEAAVEILDEGGNAVDAAVAAALALGVCEPAASGLGGQTMMLLHTANSRRTIALDGSSRAPHRATPGLLKARERLRGHRATTVPSTPATLAYAAREYGTLPWKRLLEPAIRLATKGYPISHLQHTLTTREQRNLSRGTAGKFFLRRGEPRPVGAWFRQPVLADTLTRLARRGVDDFYTGRIARAIDADMERHGGLIRLDDLAQVPWPIERRPLSTTFRGSRLMTFPPPAAGRMLIEIINIFDALPERLRDIDSPAGATAFAGVIRQALRDRRDRPFDPMLYPQESDEVMLSQQYAARQARRIRALADGRGETTHLSVMDRDGNAVSLTQSIERVYGSCTVTPDLGFLYNDYMSAFEYKQITHPYHLRPNAVPWASVAPTIVFRGHRPWIAIGSPGSERIPPSIVQVLTRLSTESPMNAVSAPRLHCSPEGLVSLEASRMRADIPAMLERRGFEVKRLEPFSFYLGCVQMVLRDRDGFHGVADPRRDGSAGGP